MLTISLRGACTHNLKRVDLDLPPGQVVALTGPSGSGKSSLALDTLYAEGQRRFVESFSPYARQFLERLPRPPTDRLDPVAATVAVDRRAPVKSSRSTLATMADLEPYLAALFSAEAVPICPGCGVAAVALTPAAAAARLLREHPGARAVLAFPIPGGRLRDEGLRTRLQDLLKDGFRRVIAGGVTRDLEELLHGTTSEVPGVSSARDAAPTYGEPRGAGRRRTRGPAPPAQDDASDAGDSLGRLAVVADRVVLGERERGRLQEAIEACWLRGGRAEVTLDEPSGAALTLTQGLACPACQRLFEPPHARLFSYNSPLGACPACKGFGRVIAVDWDKVVPDPQRTLAGGAIRPWNGTTSADERRLLKRFAQRQGIPMDRPWGDLTAAQREAVLAGEGQWEGGRYPGVRLWFQWLESRTYKMHVRVLLSRYREYALCPACAGARLNEDALRYRVADLDLGAWHALSVSEARRRVAALAVRSPEGRLAREALASRLGYLDDVGLGYLTLDRQGRTLSGGEAQRAGLTTALGAALTGTLFVLDEPSIGLHASDVARLGAAMERLARAGNTVLLVEHDEALVRRADRVVELGPGAGAHGGRVLFDGAPADLAARTDLPTGRAWQRRLPAGAGDQPRRTPSPGAALRLRGVRENNLRDVDVDIPTGLLVAVTGPSGSGKSTLVADVLYCAVARATGDAACPRPGAHRALSGHEGLTRAVLVDQLPLGRTARGNAATYSKAWDRLRARFAAEPDAAQRGFQAKHFSFNVAAGRCEACAGEGYETVEMQFLADVSYLCPLCQGKRFKPEVLEVRHRGKSVSEVLEMTVSEVLAWFDSDAAPDPVLRRALAPIARVGLGYLPLGQPLSTLSGGEAQRLKLARALSEPAAGALFVIDEPSAGLHAEDVRPVVVALHALVEQGATVVVVEHDLDVITAADWVIDLGPGAGPEGGLIVAAGPPEAIARSPGRTGQALRQRGQAAAEEVVRAAPAAPFDAAIVVDRAREHTLKGVSCRVPHGTLTVVTGPSGSGKSSLAFDVIFAEGQRRFMETLTPYARQFLPQLPRPDVDHVGGVPPAIALEQRTARGGKNSTVSTVTEVAHYLRLLYAKVGQIRCPRCGAPVLTTSAAEVFESLAARGGVHTLYAPAVRARKGTYLDLFNDASRAGLQRARVDGKLLDIEPPPRLPKTREHSIDLVVHEGPLAALSRERFDRALAWGAGSLRLAPGGATAAPGRDEQTLSTTRACAACGTGVPELDPRWFSFNTKQGQCERCEGSGVEAQGEDGGDRDAPPCKACNGTRLSPLPRQVQLQGETYTGFSSRSVRAALDQAATWRFTGTAALVARAPHAELLRRLSFIDDVGLGYLALDRPAWTLSGGEMQRLRLSAQLGSGLTGALYVLDEPTIGLHPRDTGRLLSNLRKLVDTGSTVLVVEHDEETIRAADHLIDMGPGGGRNGGQVVAAGPAAEVLDDPRSPTAQALAQAHVPSARRRLVAGEGGAWICLSGARAHNLKGATLRVPAGRLCVVAGVSGSGKSTLVQRVFLPALRRALGLVAERPLGPGRLSGQDAVKRAISVDQSPIGRTPRSVPATFLGIWDDIRRLYAGLPDAKVRGFSAARFSFNASSGGRCPACDGQGAIVSEMAFLPDVVTPCEACAGLRFEPATLEVRYRGLSAGEVLQLSADEALAHFASHRRIARPLQSLVDLGLGYLQIGQGSHTLSGGEAQRLKLATELTAGTLHEPTLYVLDEPTTGLHLSDVRRLIAVLERLVDRGDTLLVIEHQPDVISAADWVVELGPEAGEAGGEVVFTGTPAELLRAQTATGRFLSHRTVATHRDRSWCTMPQSCD